MSNDAPADVFTEWGVWIEGEPDFGVDVYSTEEAALKCAGSDKHWASSIPRTVAIRVVHKPRPWRVIQ